MRKFFAVAAATGLVLTLSACGDAEALGSMSCKEFTDKLSADPGSIAEDLNAFTYERGGDKKGAEKVAGKIGMFCGNPANADKTVNDAIK